MTPFSGASTHAATTARGAFAASSVRLQAAAASATGWGHGVNEDAHSPLDGTAPLFVVADGVGGGALAQRASRGVVACLHAALARCVIDEQRLRAAILDADRDIQRDIARCTDAAGAATFALCAAAGHSLCHWLVAWVGDCRVYRLPAGRSAAAELLTADDTYRHWREEPPRGSSLDDPARMIGNGAVDVPNVLAVEIAVGDMLMLCSDGVHKHVDAAQATAILRATGMLADRCARIVEAARAQGSRDDATVLVVRRAMNRSSKAAGEP